MKAFVSISTGLGVAVLGVGAVVFLRAGLRAGAPPAAEAPAVMAPLSQGLGASGAAGREQAPYPARGFLGVVVAGEAVDVGARTEGRIMAVEVRLGDQVDRDSVLATQDDEPLRDELAVAQASLRAARAEEKKAALELEEARERHVRWSDTVGSESGVVSAEELAKVRYEEKYAATRLEAARARVAEQQARVSELDRQIRDAVVRAPFDGLVAARYVDPGATVQRGTPVVRLVSAGDVRVRFAVPEEHGAAVAASLPVEVHIEELEVRLGGAVDKVAPEVDAASRMIIAEARVEVPESLARATLSGRVARVHIMPKARAARAKP